MDDITDAKFDADELTDEQMRRLAENPETLIGTVIDDGFGGREIVDAGEYEDHSATAQMLAGGKTVPYVELTENDFGIGMDDGTLDLGKLFKKLRTEEWSISESEVLK